MNISEAVKDYWRRFCASYPEVAADESFQVWHFGDNRQLAEELCELVIQGRKRATACLVWEAEAQPENAPVPDGYSVITDFDGNPKCIIKTTEIRVIPFREVDEAFAAQEGEGDLSLEFWRNVHWDYFSRKCFEMQREPTDSMLVLCERFEVLYQEMRESL
jgi:uncharacterized protein YhfF